MRGKTKMSLYPIAAAFEKSKFVRMVSPLPADGAMAAEI
jgi:hypothetical protein